MSPSAGSYASILPLAAPIPPPRPGRNQRAIYLMHKYWARKPWYVVSRYISHYSRPGDAVLDPFCGSGVTLSEALALGRRAIGVDLNPAAAFLSELTCRPVGIQLLNEALAAVAEAARPQVEAMYRLEGQCPRCRGPLVARWTGRGETWLEQRGGPWVRVACPKGCRIRGERRLTAVEQAALAGLEAGVDGSRPIIDRFRRAALTYADGRRFDKRRRQRTLADFYSGRNLLALDLLAEAVGQVSGEASEYLRLALSSGSHLLSRFRAPRTGHWAVNGLYVPPDWIDENAWSIWGARAGRLVAAKSEANRFLGQGLTYEVRQGDAADLSFLPPDSIDYVFTDPPYGDSIQYYELSYLWNTLLGLDASAEREVIINPCQGKDAAAYAGLLTAVFTEVYRVLKPGRWLSVTFHNKDYAVWNALLGACTGAGFRVVEVAVERPLTLAYNQLWARVAPKTDLIVSCFKPGTGDGGPLAAPPAPAPPGQLLLEQAEALSQKGPFTTAQVYDAALVEWIRRTYCRPVQEPPRVDLTVHDAELLLKSRYTLKEGSWHG
ncbi:MAG: DNA methyltransferase [Bacillota bacterium]